MSSRPVHSGSGRLVLTRRALLGLMVYPAGRRVRPGDLVARRQAAAARQAFGPAIPGGFTDVARRRDSPIRLSTAASTQELHRRGRGLRRRVSRLRQRRLARRLSAERDAAGWRSGRARPTGSIRTTATARLPTSPRRPAWAQGWGSAVTVGDYDNDGFDDLFVTCCGQNVLYHNNGDGTFTDVTEKAGLLRCDTRWGSGCTLSTTTATAGSTCSSRLTSISTSRSCRSPARTATALEGRARELRPARPADGHVRSSTTTATARSPT